MGERGHFRSDTRAIASISIRKSGWNKAWTPTQVLAGGLTPEKNCATRAPTAGAGPGDVTMLRLYIVGYTPAIAPAVGARVAQFFSGVRPPASTWVGVQALFHPDFLIEIEAMAVVPDRR